MTVRKKCRQGHFFDLTENMLIPFKNGKAVRTNCPDCGTSVILSWKDVAELLNTNIDGAKEYIAKGTTSAPVVPSKPKITPTAAKFKEPPVIDLSGFGTPNFTHPIDESESVDDIIKAIDKYEKENKMTEEQPEEDVVEDNPSPEPSIKKSVLDEALDKTSGEILRDVITTSDLPDRAKTELLDYLGYRDNLQPNELQSALEQYGIAAPIAKKVAVRYSFLLNSWNEKRTRANRMSDMMGPLGTLPIPGYNPPFGAPVGTQPPLPGQPPGNLGVPQANQPTITWMIQSYQMNPQGFLTWLQSNPQYIPLWTQATFQMQQMQYGMNPMMPQMVNPMMMGGFNAPRSSPSREDVKRMISEETGKQVDGLKQYLNQVLQPRGNDTTNVVLPILLKLIEERGQQSPPPQDPNAALMPSLIQSLLQHTLDNARGDPAMGAVIEELKELKKGFESGGSGASRTIEEFQKMIEAMRLQSQIALDQKKFEQEAISSERNRELLKNTIEQVVPAIGQVVATMAQRGSSVPPIQVPGTTTENTITLPCSACGTSIVFPKGTQSVQCPKCGAQYGVEVEKSEEKPVKSASVEVNAREDPERQIMEEDPYSFRKEGVF